MERLGGSFPWDPPSPDPLLGPQLCLHDDIKKCYVFETLCLKQALQGGETEILDVLGEA